MNKSIRKRRDLEDADEEVDPFAGGAGFQSDDDEDCVIIEPSAPATHDDATSGLAKDADLELQKAGAKRLDVDHESTGDQGSEQPTVSSEHQERTIEIQIPPGHPTFVPRGGRYFLHEDRTGDGTGPVKEDPEISGSTIPYRFRADEIDSGKPVPVELIRKELLDVDEGIRHHGTPEPKWDHALFEALEQSPEPVPRGRGGYRSRGFGRGFGTRHFNYGYRRYEGEQRRAFRNDQSSVYQESRPSGHAGDKDLENRAEHPQARPPTRQSYQRPTRPYGGGVPNPSYRSNQERNYEGSGVHGRQSSYDSPRYQSHGSHERYRRRPYQRQSDERQQSFRQSNEEFHPSSRPAVYSGPDHEIQRPTQKESRRLYQANSQQAENRLDYHQRQQRDEQENHSMAIHRSDNQNRRNSANGNSRERPQRGRGGAYRARVAPVSVAE